MSKRWMTDRKRDYYYKKAKQENYRSRAAYKLKQLDERFHIFREGDVVIDLGASPGGWSQVASELVGGSGLVLAIDIKPMEPVDGVTFIKGDARSEAVKSSVGNALPGGCAIVILSDMAPNISGNYSMDHARSIELAEMALSYSDMFLAKGGKMAVKLFDGDLTREYFETVRAKFSIARRHSPKASRKSSSELYIIAKGKR